MADWHRTPEEAVEGVAREIVSTRHRYAGDKSMQAYVEGLRHGAKLALHWQHRRDLADKLDELIEEVGHGLSKQLTA